MDRVRTVDDSKGILSGRGQLEQDTTGRLKAPDNIIMTLAAARSYYHNYRSSHIERIGTYAAIYGLVAGKPPYDARALAERGLNHIANVNTLDAKGLFERAALTFWNLSSQASNLVRFELKKLNNIADIQEDHDYSGWAATMSRHLTDIFKEEWEDFIDNLNILIGQLVLFGISPIVWSDEDDFRWDVVELSRFFTPNKMEVRQSTWTSLCFETNFTIQHLYEVYENIKDLDETDEDGKSSPYWSKEALEQYLLDRANSGRGADTRYHDFYQVQLSIQAGELNHGEVFNDTVRLVTLLYKEYSGKISQYIFDPNTQVGDKFLYRHHEKYERFSDVLDLFTYSPGERYVHNNTGIGHKIFPVCNATMQLDSHMLDMAKTSATMIISGTPNPIGDSSPIRFVPGSVTNIGTAQLQQNNLGANISHLVPVAQYMDQKVNKNAMIAGDDPSRPDVDRGSKSAPEAQMQSLKEFGVGKNSVAHFYTKLDRVFRTTVAKMLHASEESPGYDLVQEWKERCIDDGVPEEIFSVGQADKNRLPRHIKVRASRVAGDGSHLGLIMGLNGVAGISGGFGAKGQQNYRKDVITARLGEDYIDRYLSDSQDPDEAAGGASLATTENFMMEMGRSPLATRDNQHKSHVGTHMAQIMQTIKQVQSQQMDAIAADKFFGVAIPHLQQHMQFLQMDTLNREYLKQVESPFTQIVKFAQINRNRATKMMQAEQRRRAEEEQAMNAEMMAQQREDFKVERDEARKDFKVQSQVERAKEASKTRAENMRAATDAKADNQRRDIELKNENERIKIMSKPKDILANTSTQDIQTTLENQVGTTPNPVDFK